MKAYYLNKVINAGAFKLTLHGGIIFVSLLFRASKLLKDQSGGNKKRRTLKVVSSLLFLQIATI